MFKGSSDVKMIKIIQFSASVTPAITMTSLVVRTFLNPCTPFLPGYFILPECSLPPDSSKLEYPMNIYWLVVRALMCLFLYYFLLDVIGFYCIIGFQFILIQVHCIRSLLRKFRKSIEIQLLPNHDPSQVNLAHYRELQILTICYNKIQEDSVLVCVVNYTLFALVFSMYALISERESLTYLQTILLGCVSIDCLLLITVCFRVMAKLYTESVEVKKLIDCQLVVAQRDSYNRRVIKMYSRSCRLLMIRVGGIFFFDRFTTFNLLDFCVNALVNMLLLI